MQEFEEVDFKLATKFAGEMGSKLYATSAKEGTGIHQMFDEMSKMLVKEHLSSQDNCEPTGEPQPPGNHNSERSKSFRISDLS